MYINKHLQNTQVSQIPCLGCWEICICCTPGPGQHREWTLHCFTLFTYIYHLNHLHRQIELSTHCIQYSITSCHIIGLFLQHNPMLTTQPQNSPQLPFITSLPLTKPLWNEGFGGFQVSHLCIAAEHRLRGHVYADSCGRLCLLQTMGPSDCWSLATIQK